MTTPFEFTEMQAVDILDMQLRPLTRLARIDLETEIAELQRDDRRARVDPRRPGDSCAA